jgi:hypothetical protein
MGGSSFQSRPSACDASCGQKNFLGEEWLLELDSHRQGSREVIKKLSRRKEVIWLGW